MVPDDNLLGDLDLDFGNSNHDNPLKPSSKEHQAHKDLAGHYFGPYELLHRIGEGGVAQVHRARHIHPQYAERPMAIKVLHERLSDDERIRLMFRREASVLSLIKHRNVVETYEAGVQDGVLYLAMEFVEGKDLENLLWRAQKLNVDLPRQVKLFVISEVLRALAYAHELRDLTDVSLSLVHRDVNPANVFLSFDGRVKLGDFGVTSLRATSVQKSREVAGKVGYFAPEQLRGEAIDARVDLYAVGAMLFEVLTKQRLFESEDPKEAMRLNIKGDIPDLMKLAPDCPIELCRLVQRALERRAEARPASAAEFLQALLPFVGERATMQLTLRALLRQLFVADHQEILALQQQHRPLASAHASIVDLVVPDATTRQAIHALLQQRGYSVRAYETAQQAMSAVDTPAAGAVVWDMAQPLVLRDLRFAHRYGHMGTTALVALGQTLDAAAVGEAAMLGACDYVYRPMTQQRLLNAVRAAGQQQAEPHNEASLIPRPRQRALLVVPQGSLAGAARTALEDLGHLAVWVETPMAALEEAETQSFEQVVVCASFSAPVVTDFVLRLRASWGMGVTPLVLLGSREQLKELEGLPPRSATVALENDPPAPREIARGLKAGYVQLASTQKGGQMRLFERFLTQVPVDLRFGGRVFKAMAVNVSRGGLLVETLQLPSIGTPLGIQLGLPFGEDCHAQGVALRVLLGQTERVEVVRVGVAFTGFAGDGERRLIRFIGQLAQAANAAKSS